MERNELEQSAASIRARLEKYLEGKPFHFSEPKTVDAIMSAIAKRKEKYGEDYCPCRLVTGDKEKDAAIICPCVYHLKELEEDGHCHCNLFSNE